MSAGDRTMLNNSKKQCTAPDLISCTIRFPILLSITAYATISRLIAVTFKINHYFRHGYNWWIENNG